MCLFRKKKAKEVIENNKFQLGEFVRFKHRGEVDPGVIYNIKKDNEGNVIYDVQIGGECPAIVYDVKEEDIFGRK